jgi:malignant T-cell-amplified sequence
LHFQIDIIPGRIQIHSPLRIASMFKKDLVAGSKTKVKSSVQRGIRNKVLETYPHLEPHIDDIMPKKSQLDLVKLPDRVSMYSLEDKPLFWQHMDDPITPHLKIVHQYPHAFKTMRIDRGAIRFVMSGATLMVPGLTSPGGRLPDKEEAFEKGEVVAVAAEGKDEICMIGMLDVGTEEMKEKKKGPAISQGHYIGDGLWKIDLS